ncbi:Peptidase A1 [Macrophomina phaseolina MS6]|uniref:Peptidase A1 n=1 Tax=Macrophomina phaseolina (strain MS6) TaxID=1126212 RepID=K2S9V3_MACPH|nr:Peptidase A1 [Macrophomina phaseolina MS6]
MPLQRREDSIPQPYTVPTTGEWDGNDGPWSSFRLSVGTPPQDFRVLVSTRGHETFVLDPHGCTSTDPSNCTSARGAEPFNGAQSSGFNTNASSTWDIIGIYDLGLEAELGYTGNGQYGYDTIRLGYSQDQSAPALDRQVVASITDKSFFMGVIGLSPTSSSFTSISEPVKSFFRQLKQSNSIPSESYAYTAGAPYRYNKVLGNLILGGYDQARIASPPSFNFTFASDESRDLVVGVQSITATSSLNGVVAMTSTGHLSVVDSTVAELWLPTDVCDAFASNFGLSYDENTTYYLVNDTIHSRLVELNPTITFKLGNEIYTSATNSTNIALPYAAFDLQVGYPHYNTSQRYFPIRRGANDSQYTLGRTLLQEAYLIVDHERRNFTIAQTKFSDPLPSPDIVSILSPGTDDHGETLGSATGLSAGATAGIAVAVSVFGVFALVALIFCWRRRRRTHRPEFRPDAAWEQQQQQQESKPYGYPRPPLIESDSNQRFEMQGQGGLSPQDKNRQELDPGRDVAYELASAHVPMVYEMDGNAAQQRENSRKHNRFSYQR